MGDIKMKLIVISSPANLPNEHRVIESLFENGLEIFHVYKPDFLKEQIEDYIQLFPEKFYNKIFLHSQFPKFHSFKELENYKEKYEYAFLSPIFDSISKVGYKSNFDLRVIKEKVKEKRVIGLGGIDEDKIGICRELGFYGVAVLGALWKNNNPVGKFKSLKVLCEKKDLVF